MGILKEEINYNEENILDKKGNILGKVKFNPKEMKVYNRFFKILDSLLEIEQTRKKASKIKSIPEKDLKSIEEFEELKNTFKEMEKFTEDYINKFDLLAKDIDFVFGEGTTKLLCDDETDLQCLMPLIEWATPYFKKVKEEKQNKYLDDIEILEENE